MTDSTTADQKHRRIVFRLEFTHPVTRERDEDLYFGDYSDSKGQRLGELVHQRGDNTSSHAVLIPDEDIPLMHVEASLDADHTVSSFDMVVALAYGPDETPPSGVESMGEPWDASPTKLFLFEDDEAADLARNLRE